MDIVYRLCNDAVPPESQGKKFILLTSRQATKYVIENRPCHLPCSENSMLLLTGMLIQLANPVPSRKSFSFVCFSVAVNTFRSVFMYVSSGALWTQLSARSSIHRVKVGAIPMGSRSFSRSLVCSYWSMNRNLSIHWYKKFGMKPQMEIGKMHVPSWWDAGSRNFLLASENFKGLSENHLIFRGERSSIFISVHSSLRVNRLIATDEARIPHQKEAEVSDYVVCSFSNFVIITTCTVSYLLSYVRTGTPMQLHL